MKQRIIISLLVFSFFCPVFVIPSLAKDLSSASVTNSEKSNLSAEGKIKPKHPYKKMSHKKVKKKHKKHAQQIKEKKTKN